MNPVWAILYGSKQKSFITRTQSPSSDSLKMEKDCASDASKTNFFVTKIENLPLELSNADWHVENDRIDSNVEKKENCFFEDGSTDSNVPFVDLKLELELESVKVETFDDTLSSLNVQPKSEENKLLDSSLIKSERSSDCHTQIRVFPTNNNNETEEMNVKTEESFLRNHKSGDAIIKDCFVKLEKLVDRFNSNQLSQTKADMTSESCSDFQKSFRVSMVMPEKTRLQQCHSHTSGQMATASTSTSTSVETIQSSGMDQISNGQDKHFEHPIDYELEAVTFEQFCGDADIQPEQHHEIGMQSNQIEADGNSISPSSRDGQMKVGVRRTNRRKRSVKIKGKKKSTAHEQEVNQGDSVGGLRCAICLETFHQEYKIVSHINEVHGAELKPYQCTICHERFCKFKSLKHIKIHREKANMRVCCNACDLDFEDYATFRAHRRFHHKCFQCATCNLLCGTINDLKKHMRIHSGERPYKCSVCNKKFRENSKLTRHLRIHTGEKRFFCTVCREGFGENYKLKRHMSKHNPKIRKNYCNRFKCPICSQEFIRPGSLTRHIRKRHSS